MLTLHKFVSELYAAQRDPDTDAATRLRYGKLIEDIAQARPEVAARIEAEAARQRAHRIANPLCAYVTDNYKDEDNTCGRLLPCPVHK